jgi:hypothetical protein
MLFIERISRTSRILWRLDRIVPASASIPLALPHTRWSCNRQLAAAAGSIAGVLAFGFGQVLPTGSALEERHSGILGALHQTSVQCPRMRQRVAHLHKAEALQVPTGSLQCCQVAGIPRTAARSSAS